MKNELTGDEPDVFTPEEQATISTWQVEEAMVLDAIRDGALPWQLTPMERLKLTSAERKEAMADPDRMKLADLAEEEKDDPILKRLRVGGGVWLQAETIRRLKAVRN